jgi:glycosyltransferase involved in cell wall biosynthesis
MSDSNILIAANYSNTTGYAWNNIYRLFDKIIQEFSSDKRQICVTFAEINQPISQIESVSDVTFEEWDPINRSLKNTFKLCKIIKKHNIKNIYLTDQSYYDWRYLFFRLYGARKIVVHSRISVANPYPANFEGGVRGLLKSMIGKINILCATRVYAVSNFVKNRLVFKNRAPEGKVVTILNGIDIAHFQPQHHNEPSNKLTIFSGGRATKHKGIHILIEAIRLLREYSNDIDLEVRYAGDGPEMSEFRSMVNKYNLDQNFTFLGELSNTQEEVCNADIIVVPSVWGDACPSSVSEALASGKALIATRAGGIPEIVGNEGNAILVEPGDAFTMSIALLALAKSHKLRDKLSKNARSRAEEALNKDDYYHTVLKQLHKDFRIPEHHN